MSPVRPNLSVCMIVRDDADLLGRALECATQLADEVIVVDRGSEHDSPGIAARAGARVLHFAWSDDFSAARNAALDAAVGRWIFVLDADEILDGHTIEELKRLVSEPADHAYRVRQRNYVDHAQIRGFLPNDIETGEFAAYPGFLPARQTRLFPNRSELRYRGVVHEEVHEALLEAGIECRDLELDIHHLGKVRGEAVRRRKQELYMRLSRRKAEEDSDPHAWLELGVQLLESGRDSEAFDVLEPTARGLPAGAELARCVSSLAKIEMRRGDLGGAERRLREALPQVGRWLDPWQVLAEVILRRGQNDNGVEVLQMGLHLFPRDPHLLRLLAGAHVALGQWARASKYFERLRELLPEDDGAWRGLAVSQLAAARDDKVGEILSRLGQPQGGEDQWKAALDALRQLGRADRAEQVEGMRLKAQLPHRTPS